MENDTSNEIYQTLKGFSSQMVLERVLKAIDSGVTTDEIRRNPLKYLTSGKTKEIVINTGGEGLKVCPEIIHEMAKRGDVLAQEIIDNKSFRTYNTFGLGPKLQFAYLKTPHQWIGEYDRTNKTLIQIIKEGTMKNNGGMDLVVAKVYDDSDYEMYQIRNVDDDWSSEYIDGWHKIIAEIKG